ncbi:MAG: hypothetical protein JRD68_13565 [Deltaproteobacteria bacterium]|nr:hypothetical protein [Deltaproteobacteria bacterium]
MFNKKILPHLVLTILLILPLALLDSARTSYAGGKGKAEDAQNSKAKKQKKDQSQKGKKAREKKDEQWKPPGWSRGEKVGWKGESVPPGFNKWDKNKQKKWKKNKTKAMKQAEDWIRDRARKKNMDEDETKAETESVLTSLDGATRAGVPLSKVLEVIRKSINKDVSGQNIERISRAMAHTASKGADPEEVVSYTGELLDENVSGQEVALKIYRWFGRKLEKSLNH